MRASILKSKIKEYGLLLILVLLVELLVCNFSTLKTLGAQEFVIAEDVRTNQLGIFETEIGFSEKNHAQKGAKIQNIYVDLDIERYDRALVQISLTDEGDFYAYDMPPYEMIPAVRDSGYQNIYPFGKVHSLKVRVSVPEGTEAHIYKIVLNYHRPMQIKWIRVLVLYAFLFLGVSIWRNKSFVTRACERNNRKQLIVTGLVVLFLCVLGGLLTTMNPVCMRNLWPHHGQYQELAHVLSQGEVVLPDVPDERLLAKENPYDTSALLAEEIFFKMDYAFYNGNYYAYFGIVPALLLYLPTFLLTGKDLPNYIAVFALYSGLIVGTFGLIWELIFRVGKKVPYVAYLLMSVAISMMSNFSFMASRPDIYHVAVMAGNCFLMLGCYFLVKGLNCENTQKRKALWYFIGALCFSLVAGCRPQMLLHAVFILLIFVPEIVKRRLFSKDSRRETLAICIPVILVAGIVFWYNYARFGSGFDFGATYSLTSNDMNHRGFNFSRTIRGVFSFFFQPPVLSATFPFLSSTVLEGNYMGKNIVEFCYGGVFVSCPFVFSLLYYAVGGHKNVSKQVKWSILLLTMISLVIGAFDVNGAGIIQRYMSDMVIGVLIGAALMWICLLSEKENGDSRAIAYRLLYLACVAGLAFSFLTVIASGDSVNIHNYNPVLYYKLASYFRF